jgi:predicted nucleic-acid-binding Zn-ribbon protein
MHCPKCDYEGDNAITWGATYRDGRDIDDLKVHHLTCPQCGIRIHYKYLFNPQLCRCTKKSRAKAAA